MARNVLVTGSSHGIGAAVAIAFAKQGDNVGVVYNKTLDGAEKTASEVTKSPEKEVRTVCAKVSPPFLRLGAF